MGASLSYILSKYFLVELYNSNRFLIENKEKLKNLVRFLITNFRWTIIKKILSII